MGFLDDSVEFEHSLVDFIVAIDEVLSNFVSLNALISFLLDRLVFFVLTGAEIGIIMLNCLFVIINQQLCHFCCIVSLCTVKKAKNCGSQHFLALDELFQVQFSVKFPLGLLELAMKLFALSAPATKEVIQEFHC